jgi:L-ascorbate metabolism protein UlaG (beta-lactamase superfamily)
VDDSTTQRVTWLGHATALVEIGEDRVLIDPLGRRRCRKVEGYRAVLITHAHVDHLNRWTLAKLDREAELLVPKGASPIVADLGFRKVTEVEPGDQLSIGGLDIIGVPTRHDPGRWRKGDTTGNTGYIIHKEGFTVHHSGDIDMSTYEVFDDIGKQFDIDAALLPIGGMLPVWYYRLRNKTLDRGVHIDPDTALHIFERLGARTLVPVHWGTLHLRLGLPSMPRRRLAKIASLRGARELVRILRHGESLPLSEVKAEGADDAHESDGDADV